MLYDGDEADHNEVNVDETPEVHVSSRRRPKKSRYADDISTN
jgi:hypothetical protein